METYKNEVAERWERDATRYLFMAWILYCLCFALLLHGIRWGGLDESRWAIALAFLFTGIWVHSLRLRCLRKAQQARSNHGKGWIQ